MSVFSRVASRRRSGFTLAAVAIVLSVAVTVPAAATVWGFATAIHPPAGSTASYAFVTYNESCVSVGNCVAVGGTLPNASGNDIHPVIATETSGVWGTPVVLAVPSGASSPVQGALSGISCTSIGNCVAVGAYTAGTLASQLPMVAVETNGVWSALANAVLPSNAFSQTNKSSTQSSATSAGLESVSCPVAGTCVAVGTYTAGTAKNNYIAGLVDTWSAGQWTAAEVEANPTSAPAVVSSTSESGWFGVSCVDAMTCTLVGTYDTKSGYQWVSDSSTSGTWSPAVEIPQPTGSVAVTSATAKSGPVLQGVSCTSAGNCEAIGQYVVANASTQAAAITETNGVWGSAAALPLPTNAAKATAKVPQLATPNAISCPTVGVCAVVGQYDASFTGVPSTLAGATWVLSSGSWTVTTSPVPSDYFSAQLYAGSTGVSCVGTTIGTCGAVGYYLTAKGNLAGFSYAPTTVPGAPSSVRVTPYNSSAVVSWTASTTTGGQPITGYTVTASPGGASCTTSTTSCTVTGLTNASSYTFTVTATNANGASVASAPSASTEILAVPATVQSPTAVARNASATISWTAPVSNGSDAVSGYTVTASPGGATCSPASVTSTTCTVTGLVNGTTYTFSVVATNDQGNGPAAVTNAVTPATVPGAAVIVKVTPATTSASLVLKAPTSTGGARISSYQVSVNGGSWATATSTGTTTASPVVSVTGLKAKVKYSVRVRAVNAAGAGTASAASSFTTL